MAIFIKSLAVAALVTVITYVIIFASMGGFQGNQDANWVVIIAMLTGPILFIAVLLVSMASLKLTLPEKDHDSTKIDKDE